MPDPLIIIIVVCALIGITTAFVQNRTRRKFINSNLDQADKWTTEYEGYVKSVEFYEGWYPYTDDQWTISLNNDRVIIEDSDDLDLVEEKLRTIKNKADRRLNERLFCY